MGIWTDWAKQLLAVAQAGKTYGKDEFDLQRYEQVADIAHQMFAQLSDATVEKVKELFLPETGYPTPKVDLRGGVIRDGKILLVRERIDNRWTLPGGWADVCESPSEGIVREVGEESGLTVANPRLAFIKDRAVHPYWPEMPFHIYKMFFLCDYVSGETSANLEVSEVGFFDRDNIPDLSTTRTLPEDIELMFDHHANPDLPVMVD